MKTSIKFILLLSLHASFFSCESHSSGPSPHEKAQVENKIHDDVLSPELQIQEEQMPAEEKIAQLPKKSIYKEDRYSVISPNGLNLRNGPSLTSDVIMKIPYLEVVFMQDIFDVKRDTLFKIANHKEYDISQFGNNIIGDWVKVKHSDEIGFVFSPYLLLGVFNNAESMLSSRGSKNYFLNIVGRRDGLCFHTQKITNWYRMIAKDNGLYFQPTSINYRIDHRLNWRQNPAYVYSSPYSKYGLLLGTDRKMSTQTIDLVAQNIKIEYDSLYANFPVTGKLKEESARKLNELNFDLRKVENKDGVELILTDGDKRQVLNTEELSLEDCWPDNINFVTDIDQDGILDYLINFAGDKTLGELVLFLSSEANSDQIVKPVALYSAGWPE